MLNYLEHMSMYGHILFIQEGEINNNNAGDGMEDDNSITCHKMVCKG